MTVALLLAALVTVALLAGLVAHELAWRLRVRPAGRRRGYLGEQR